MVLLDTHDQVRYTADDKTKRDTTDDVERRVCAEVDAGERDEGYDRPGQDPPSRPEVRGEHPGQPGDENDVSRNEREARGRRVATNDRTRYRRARPRSLNKVPDDPFGRELSDGDDDSSKRETPSPEHRCADRYDRSHREDTHELRDLPRRCQHAGQPIDPLE